MALVLVFAMFVPAYLKAQEVSDPAILEQQIAAAKAKLRDASLDPVAKERMMIEIASLLNHLGEVRFARAEYEASTSAFVEADAVLKTRHESVYERAKKDLKDAEVQFEKFRNEPDPAKKEGMANIGSMILKIALSTAISEATELGDTVSLKAYIKRLIQVSKEDGDTEEEAKGVEKLGGLEFDYGDADKAFELYARARELRKIQGKKEFWTIDYIARARWYLGDYDAAIAGFNEIVQLTQAIDSRPPEIKPNASETLKQAIKLERSVVRMTLIQALLDLAQIYSLKGQYGEIPRQTSEVLRVIEEMKLDEADADDAYRSILVLARASVQAKLSRQEGRLLEVRGDAPAAIGKYSQAVDIFRQISGGDPSGAVAGLMSRLAMLYSDQGKFDEARANIRESMRIRARLHQENGTAYSLMQASRIELAAKQTDAAIKYSRQAKAAALQLSLDDLLAEASEVEADALSVKATDPASILFEQAIVGYRSAIEIYKKLELRPFQVRAATSLGSVYERIGKSKEAEAAYKDAIAVSESIRTTFSSETDSTGYANRGDIILIYKKIVDLLVKQGRAEEALQYATRAQRRDLVENIPLGQIKLAGGGDALRAVNAAQQRESAAVANLTGALEGNNAEGSKATKLISALGSARQNYALAIKRLEVEQPNLRFTVRPTDLLKLQSSLAPSEAIVSYLVTDDRLQIFVVTTKNVAVRTVQIRQSELRALVAQAREGLKDFSADFYDLSSDPEAGFAEEKKRPDIRIDDKSEHYRKTLSPINNSLRSLYKELVSPIEDLIENAQTIKVIPNAELFLIPFGALVSPTDGKYLIEKHELVFLTAGDMIGSRLKVPANALLVAFGDPAEANLDGALDEVKSIQKVFPKSQLFTDSKATKVQLFKLTNAKILHFATHGHIRNPLEASTIQLARLPGVKDPDLSYGEIFALPLESTDMIVLSACETALGGTSGTEVGVFIEAFRPKTNSVAASLWSVDDYSTRELMIEFYKGLAAGLKRSTAMQRAQLKLLRDGRTKNPYFWGAFVLYGDGGRLAGIAPAGK